MPLNTRNATRFTLVALIVAAFFAWTTLMKAEDGVGILHHIQTKGFDSSAIVSVVVVLVLAIAYYAGRDRTRNKDGS